MQYQVTLGCVVMAHMSLCQPDSPLPPLHMMVMEPQLGCPASMHSAWLASLGQNIYCKEGKMQQ